MGTAIKHPMPYRVKPILYYSLSHRPYNRQNIRPTVRSSSSSLFARVVASFKRLLLSVDVSVCMCVCRQLWC